MHRYKKAVAYPAGFEAGFKQYFVRRNRQAVAETRRHTEDVPKYAHIGKIPYYG